MAFASEKALEAELRMTFVNSWLDHQSNFTRKEVRGRS
jgi:hypothetical protein